MKKKMKKIVLSAFLIISLMSTFCINGYAVGGSSEVFEGRVFVSDVKSQLAPGAWEHKITTNNTSGTDQNIDFVSEIDLSGTETIKIVSCYAGYSTINGENISWQMMTLPEQAQKAQAYFDADQTKYPNYKVVGVLVGDTYNMGTGQPSHVLVIDGVTYQNADGTDYFAIDKSGNAIITTSTDTSNIAYAVGGMGRLVSNGQNVASRGNAYVDGSFSRAAVGITEQGNVITFCTYGNSYPISCGYTWSEVADYMIAQGCVDALMLDGSGSAEWCARYEGTNSVESVSHPSDGSSRSVGSCLLIVSTAAPDGTFARASITPNASVYTPNSTVQFEAVGADSAGNAAAIPEGATWSLADDDYGTVDQTGKFVSNGTCGDVTVNLNYEGRVCGTSTITIATPDSITFSKTSEDVGRGKSSNLGLQVRYQNREVVLKDGDIAWTLTNDNESSDEVIGSVEFAGGKYLFTGNSSVTCSGVVKAEYSGDSSISGSIQVKVGTDPVKALDFEAPADGKTLEEYYGLDEDDYIIGRSGGSQGIAATGLLTRLFYGRGGNETARIVSASEGYPVHSGSNALQVNYDFSECATGITEGANVGLTEAVDIPGHPTAIGLWVWVPENTPNLWLRVRLSIYNPNGDLNTTTQFDFGPQINETFPKDGSYGGLTICEEGTWYFCTADLSSYDGCTFQIPAGEAIRLMRTDGATVLSYNGKNITQSHGKYLKDGTEVNIKNLKGSVYFDDLMFIYGSVNEDTDAPRVKDALLGSDNNVSFYDGMTVESNSEVFSFYMEDAKGASGIDPVGLDYDACYLYVDGDLMNGKAGTVIDRGSDCIRTDVTLANGEHSIRLLLSDKNGNKSSKTYNFTVSGNESTYPTYSLATDADFAPLGGSVPLAIHTTDATNIDKFTTTMQVDSRYKNGGYEITAAEGFSYEAGSAKYDEVNSTVTFEVTATGNKTGECDIATITFGIDKDLAEGSYFSYTVTAGIETAKTQEGADAGNYHGGFSLPQARLKVEAPYTISSDLLYQNMANPGYIYVKDTNGQAVSGIGIYKQDGTLLGTTDETGRWQVSSTLLASVQQLVVYASCDSGISFNETVSIFGTDAEESPIIFTACGEDGKAKQLSWLSGIQKKVELRYASSDEALESQEAVTAVSEPVKFGGSSFSDAVTAQTNSVKLTDLQPGEYYYQYRYGDGNWSAAESFTVKRTGSTTSFFVLGDVQAADTSNIDAIIGNLKTGEYDFGIQTGDLVDQAYSYSHWKDAMTLMSKLGDQDMLYALGNHENNMGDDGSIAKKIYRMPSKEYYSVEYGNVYVANISYNSLEGYKKALEWLVTDAKKSSAKWKIVTMHQPTYYTNSTATDNVGMDKLTPSYLQEAGINMVFSGHDHSYARTAALVDGKRSASYNSEKETCTRGDGIVYYICGSSGEKSYPIDPTLPFDYKATSDFNAIYLTAEANNNTLTVKTYDLKDAQTGETECIDTFTMYVSACVTGDHKFTGGSYYDLTQKTLTCSICGEAVAASESGYTGIAKCGEKQVYLFNGAIKTGWITIGEEVVHTGDDSILHDTLSFTTETCTQNGTRMAYCEECNITKSYGTNVKYHNHIYDSDYRCQNSYYDENHQLHECGWTGVDINTLTTTLAYKYGYYDGEARRPKVTVKDADGEELLNQSTYGDYVAYYSDNTDVGVATIRLVAYNSYYGERTLHFEVRPSNVSTLQTEEVTESSVKLSWEKSLGAEKYAVYQGSGSTWKKIGDTADTSYEIKNLSSGTTYKFRIRPYAVVKDTKQRLDGSYDETYWSTQYSGEVSVKTSGTSSSGSSSSSGGSSGGYVTPSANTTTNTGDTTSTTVKPATTTGANGTKTTAATVDTAVAEEIIKNAVSNKSQEMIVDATSTKSVTETAAGTRSEVTLSATAVSNIASKTEAAFTIRTDAAEVKLDREAVKAVAEAAGSTGDVKLEVATLAQDDAKVQVDLKLVTSGGNVSEFKGGNVSVTIKLNAKLAAKAVKCLYIDDAKAYHKVAGQKNADGTYTFTTGHFSSYAVMEADEADKLIAEQTAKVEKLVSDLTLKARSAKTAKGHIKVTLTVDSDAIRQIEDLGYTVKYKFYRSTKKAKGYKAKIEGAGKTYTNTAGTKGTKYYYKARVMVYDAQGALITKTALTQCKYACRIK